MMISIQVKLILNTDEEKFASVMVNNPSDIPKFIDFGAGEAFVFARLETVIMEEDKGLAVVTYPVYLRDSRNAGRFMTDWQVTCASESVV
jgi:hypothetical protein